VTLSGALAAELEARGGEAFTLRAYISSCSRVRRWPASVCLAAGRPAEGTDDWCRLACGRRRKEASKRGPIDSTSGRSYQRMWRGSEAWRQSPSVEKLSRTICMAQPARAGWNSQRLNLLASSFRAGGGFPCQPFAPGVAPAMGRRACHSLVPSRQKNRCARWSGQHGFRGSSRAVFGIQRRAAEAGLQAGGLLHQFEEREGLAPGDRITGSFAGGFGIG